MEFWKSHVVRNIGSENAVLQISGFYDQELLWIPVASERFSTTQRRELPSSWNIQGPWKMLLALFIGLGPSKMNATLSFESSEPLSQWRIFTSRKIGILDYTAVKTLNLTEYLQPLRFFCKRESFSLSFCYFNALVTEKK